MTNAYAGLLEQNAKAIDVQQQQIVHTKNVVVESLQTYSLFLSNVTTDVFSENEGNILSNFATLKNGLLQTNTQLYSSSLDINIVEACIAEEGHLDILGKEINEQIKACATTSMAEIINVVTDSLDQAQSFMSLTTVIGRDIQRCGLNYACRWDIVGDSIREAIQVRSIIPTLPG